jgi:RNA polymerase sigma factor (sigma-70 family)
MDELSTVKNKWVLTQESFDKLLAWLDADREAAGKKYEEIRFKLIKIFVRRGCTTAEDLSDETINRVTRKILEIGDTYVGDPALYFYGVAHNVYLEHIKKRAAPLPLPRPDSPERVEQNYECLQQCINRLPPESRELIIEYYQEEKQAKIKHRKELALRMGVTLNTLRMRAHRIKVTLQDCVLTCLKRAELI